MGKLERERGRKRETEVERVEGKRSGERGSNVVGPALTSGFISECWLYARNL